MFTSELCSETEYTAWGGLPGLEKTPTFTDISLSTTI
jgi:hypothetical protein